MALEKTFREFSIQLRRLGDRLQELRVTVVEDKPSKNDAAIVDNFEYAVEDLLGWLNETLEAARKAECSVEQGLDLSQARRALTTCQEQFRRLEQDFNANLVSYEKMKDLTSFGNERRGQWQSWVSIVKQGIEQCRQPLEDAAKALAECWQEIAEKVGTTSISVRNTNIGQKIARVSTADKETAPEGIT